MSRYINLHRLLGQIGRSLELCCSRQVGNMPERMMRRPATPGCDRQ